MITDNLVKELINDGLPFGNTKITCEKIEQKIDHCEITLLGGNNGIGRLTNYLSDLKLIVDQFDTVWLIKCMPDNLDDLWMIRLGVK